MADETDDLPSPDMFFSVFAGHINSLSAGEMTEKLHFMGEVVSEALMAFPVELGPSFQYDFFEKLDPLRRIQVFRAITNEARVALEQVLD